MYFSGYSLSHSLSLCGAISAPATLHRTLPISSLSNGLRPELSGDLQGPSALPFLPQPPHPLTLPLSLFFCGQLNSSDSSDRGPAGASDWTGPGPHPSLGLIQRLVRLL